MSQGARPVTSPTRKRYLRRRRLYQWLVVAVQVSLVIGLILLWELAARKGWIDAFIMSQPTRIWSSIMSLYDRGELFMHLGVTVFETAVGFTVGTLGGILIAIVLWWSPFWSRVFDPFIVMLNSVPKVALGPILIVWLGTNMTAVLAMAVAVSIIVTIMMVFNGFKEVDAGRITLVRSFGANKWQILTKVVLASSIPTMIAALKVNVGLALVGTIVGEFLASKAGLGFLIIYGGQVFNMHLVMASVMLLMVVSVALYYLVSGFERLIVKGRD